MHPLDLVHSFSHEFLHPWRCQKSSHLGKKWEKSQPWNTLMGQPIGWFSPSPSIVWQASLVSGRLTNLNYIPARLTESFHWLGRRIILLQKCRSGNRTRVTQPKLTLVQAPYPLDQCSFLKFCLNLNFRITLLVNCPFPDGPSSSNETKNKQEWHKNKFGPWVSMLALYAREAKTKMQTWLSKTNILWKKMKIECGKKVEFNLDC